MGELTKNFPPTQASAVATYDFIDFAEGRGIANFNCFVTEDSVGEKEQMNRTIMFASTTVSQANVNAGSFQKVIEKNFDLSPFNNPATIEGTATFQVPLNWAVAGAAGSRQAYVIAKVIQVRGGTPDILVSAQSATLSQSTDVDKFKVMSFQAIVPPTNFSFGDILRVSIEVWGKKVSGNQGVILLGHSPNNRNGEGSFAPQLDPEDDTSKISKLNAFIPFKVDIG